MTDMLECFKCGKKMRPGEESSGINLGFGPQYWCHTCRPSVSAEEAINMVKNFLDPPHEKGNRIYSIDDLVETFIEPRYRSRQKLIIKSLIEQGFNIKNVLRQLPSAIRKIRSNNYGVKTRPFDDVLFDFVKFTKSCWLKWSK